MYSIAARITDSDRLMKAEVQRRLDGDGASGNRQLRAPCLSHAFATPPSATPHLLRMLLKSAPRDLPRLSAAASMVFVVVNYCQPSVRDSNFS